MPSPSIDLLRRMDKPGPRYTSYPTVPHWDSAFSAGSFTSALATVQGPLSVYVHLPFCEEQCTFCGCNMVVAGRRAAGKRYLRALERQVAELPLSAEQVPAARVHLGGGTPTWFDPDELRELMAILDRRFVRGERAGFSVEADPAITTDVQLETLVELGLTRLSFGVQSFDPTVLAAVQRPQKSEHIERLVARSRSLGIGGINLDLIYGLPEQTAERFAQTLLKVTEIRPDRLAIYSYAHVPWLKPHQRRIDEAKLPTPEEKLALFLLAYEMLTQAGYRYIGMDHFALPEDPLSKALDAGTLRRDFMGYTTSAGVGLVGLGMSAISDVGGVYCQQEAKLGRWYRGLESGIPVVRGCVLSAEDALRREVISALMCEANVDLAVVCGRHGVAADHFDGELGELAALERDGLVEIDGHRIAVTEVGRLFLRNVAMVFDQYLGASSGPRYSRTV